MHGLDGIEDLTPEQAWGRVARAAGQLDGMADPLATAALGWAEERFTPSPRLSGLGGEVARGFYYDASGRTRPVTSARSRRLAGWRLFVNEAVEREALTPEFAVVVPVGGGACRRPGAPRPSGCPGCRPPTTSTSENPDAALGGGDRDRLVPRA